MRHRRLHQTLALILKLAELPDACAIPVVGGSCERHTRAGWSIAVEPKLSDPQCRLLTQVAPGGVGKTRLTIEAASPLLGQFTQGVYIQSKRAWSGGKKRGIPKRNPKGARHYVGGWNCSTFWVNPWVGG